MSAPAGLRLLASAGLLLSAGRLAPGAEPGPATADRPARICNCYEPVPGGWRIRLGAGSSALSVPPGSRIGAVTPDPNYGNPRLHRRPLYPPADRSRIFTPEEMTSIERCGFRPLVLAYVEPRFLFDFHSAGGLLGHLYLGLVGPGGQGRWLHEWSDLEVSYVDGRMEYLVRDPAFPGTTVMLQAAPAAGAAGLILRVRVDGADRAARLVWAYGGASAFFTNWAMTSPEFRFQPGHCEDNTIAWEDGRFLLTRGFAPADGIMKEVFAVPRVLKGWQALVQGGSSIAGRSGTGEPAAFAAGPAELVRSATWDAAGPRENCVVVREMPLVDGRAEGFITVGMGGDIVRAIRHPGEAWQAALDRNTVIARRVVTRTPDPHLDAAMSMMAFATEGTWGDTAILHGGWSWRFAYLGWRHWYGSDAYGWSDRVATSIRNHVRLNRVSNGPDEGALGSLLEYSPGVYYNMNEVFLDQVRHYFDYTGDLDLMREIFPVLEGILRWEDRRLRPAEAPLYESALNTWISDQHWYIRGQCTQASAYMLQAHRFLADLARRLGTDPAPHERQAEAIREALQSTLWMRRPGVFAEYLDTRGARLLHPEPELPTIYHAAEFRAAEPLQVWQMLHWVDTHLRGEDTPDGGRLVWSSRWFPNMGRSYTHSTYEMAYAEELNLALANHLVGRAAEAWALERGCLAGIFNGPTPGGLACHSYTDGRQRANDEFADAISMWARAVVEGLFGIVPRRPDGRIDLSPQLPVDWPDASIVTPHLGYRLRRQPGRIEIAWTTPAPARVRLRLPVRGTAVTRVLLDGRAIHPRLEAGVDLTWMTAESGSARSGEFQIHYEPRPAAPPARVTVHENEDLSVPVDGSGVLDPQGLLDQSSVNAGRLTGRVVGTPGPGVLFVNAGGPDCPYQVPIRLSIGSPAPVIARAWTPPRVPDRDLARWILVDLAPVYNASVTDALKRVHDAAKPPPEPASPVNTGYYKSHLVAPFVAPAPEDAAWRAKVAPDGVAWTFDGIPFRTAREGPNIAVVTRAAAFPDSLEVPLHGAGQTLYLMISGTTFAVQSHVVNLRLTLRYTDGTEHSRDLVNPVDIGDCWNQYRFHDTAANGFENLGGRSGPPGSAAVKDLTKPVAVDTEAHLLAIDLKPGATVASLRLKAVAEDVVFGIMGASILK